MSRQMKFRFWDKLYSKMSDPISMRHLATEHRAYKDEYIEWLQWTGLQDKNGQDIYEGDIVSKEYEYSVTEIGYIKFTEGSFLVYFDEQPDASFCIYGDTDRHEVIGNIHANPELINPIQEIESD